MQKAEIVRGLLFPSDEKSSRAVHPRVSAFDDPTPCTSFAAMRTSRVFAFRRNVDDVSTALCGTPDCFRVVAFVGTQMLSFAQSRPWTSNWNTAQSLDDQFLIMHIGAGDGHAKRKSRSIGQHRAFDAEFAAIRRVFPCFFPHPTEPSPSRRPNFATPNRCLGDRRILPERFATAFGIRRVRPTLESKREWRSPIRIRSASLSIGNQFAAHTKFRSPRFATATADVPLYNSVCNSGRAVRCGSIERREAGETLTHNFRPSAHLHAVLRTTTSQNARCVPITLRVLG